MQKKRRQTQKWRVGSVFLVPLPDDTYAMAQVLGPEEFGGFVPVVVFDTLVLSLDRVVQEGPRTGAPIARSSVGKLSLDDGSWPVVGQLSVTLPSELWPNAEHRYPGSDWIGAKFDNTVNVEFFLRALWGLSPWDGMKDPEYYHRFLIDPSRRPQTSKLANELQ